MALVESQKMANQLIQGVEDKNYFIVAYLIKKAGSLQEME